MGTPKGQAKCPHYPGVRIKGALRTEKRHRRVSTLRLKNTIFKQQNDVQCFVYNLSSNAKNLTFFPIITRLALKGDVLWSVVNVDNLILMKKH